MTRWVVGGCKFDTKFQCLGDVMPSGHIRHIQGTVFEYDELYLDLVGQTCSPS